MVSSSTTYEVKSCLSGDANIVFSDREPQALALRLERSLAVDKYREEVLSI